MPEPTPEGGTPVYRRTAHASLAARGVKLRRLDLFGPVRERVRIPQKTVRHTPADKLYDALIALLAGAHGLVESNRLLRADAALPAAFGRPACAAQAVVRDTLDACTAENVRQMDEAMAAIDRRHSRGDHHDYAAAWPILDADLRGLPCGKKAALATPGYFARPRTRQGRQRGRVLATRYHEVVVDQLFSGTTQLTTALLPLLLAAEETRALDEARRQRTLVRVDAGAGSVADSTWALFRGYQILAKGYSTKRARLLAESVAAWYDEPRQAARQVGLVTAPSALDRAGQHRRTATRVAVRCRQANGQWGVAVLISTLSAADALHLTAQAPALATDPAASLLAYAYLDDQRGGGVETTFKEDKQGLGLTRRNKKRFEAQQVVAAPGTLAHNILIWARAWLAAQAPRLRRFGVKRLVRDACGIGGLVAVDPHGRVAAIVLNRADRLAHQLLAAFQALIAAEPIGVSLGEI